MPDILPRNFLLFYPATFENHILFMRNSVLSMRSKDNALNHF